MAERVRITGNNDGINQNEGIDAQVDNTFKAVHTKSHLYGYDGIGFSNPVAVNSSGEVKVNAASLPLPSGAATSANQVTLEAVQEEIKILAEGIYELAKVISCIASAKGIAADIRVTPLATPNMNTLTTLTGITNIGSNSAAGVVKDLSNMSAQNNINNIQS